MDSLEVEFRRLPLEELSSKDRLIAESIRLAFRQAKALKTCDAYAWRIGTFGGDVHRVFAEQLLYQITSVEDIEAVVTCLRRAPQVFAQMERNLQSAKERGYMVPRLVHRQHQERG